MNKTLTFFISALAALGMFAGCYIIASNGFTASNKRGNWSVFVPAPEAYIMALIMFALSIIAVIWLIRKMKSQPWVYVMSAVGYIGVALLVIQFLAIK